MSRETQRKGDLAKAKAIAYFAERNWDVASLLTESASYDLIVDTGQGLYRVQVKYTSTSGVDLRRIHSNTNGYVVKTYDDKAFDWLFIYQSNGDMHLIEWSEIPNNYVWLKNRVPLATWPSGLRHQS